MSNMQSQSEDNMMFKDCIDSPSVEEVSSGSNREQGTALKKGPWTSAEDAILVDYVTKHGEGNWNAVQKHSGLSRCGKSCRLRWANHLRPDLKKGAFTAEEEHRIIELHAKMGNKWARMASELPGRTDNEIKNYWNTRIKRRQRAGLPIYPPDICLLKESQLCQNMGTFSPGDTCHPDVLPGNNFEIPAIEFKNLELSEQLYPPAFLDISASGLLDIPASSLLAQGLDSYGESFMFQAMHPTKRLRESESSFSGLRGRVGNSPPAFSQHRESESSFSGLLGSVGNSPPAFSQHHSSGPQKIARSFGFSSANDHNLSDNQSSSSSFPGSHALINGNSSSSEPMPWAMKMELPSLQFTDTQVACWGTPSSPLPSLESVDTLIQSPPPERTPSECVSPRKSGLLEAVLYESRTLKSTKGHSHQQNSNASPMPNETGDSLSQDLHETEWDAYCDPISPLGHSAASVFSEYTPTSGNSLDEPQPTETISGTKVKEEAPDWVSARDNDEDIFKQRPDFLLGSNCFGPSMDHGKDHSILKDAIGALLGEDFSNDCKRIGDATASSNRVCGHGHESTIWGNLSTV